MRPVDADKLLDDITAAKECGGMGAIVAGTLRRYVMRQPTLTQPNEPLTIEQLREMGGQPYWHVGLREESAPPHWNILDPFYAKHIEDYKYGENWIAYRRPPERQGGDADHA